MYGFCQKDAEKPWQITLQLSFQTLCTGRSKDRGRAPFQAPARPGTHSGREFGQFFSAWRVSRLELLGGYCLRLSRVAKSVLGGDELSGFGLKDF